MHYLLFLGWFVAHGDPHGSWDATNFPAQPTVCQRQAVQKRGGNVHCRSAEKHWLSRYWDFIEFTFRACDLGGVRQSKKSIRKILSRDRGLIVDTVREVCTVLLNSWYCFTNSHFIQLLQMSFNWQKCSWPHFVRRISAPRQPIRKAASLSEVARCLEALRCEGSRGVLEHLNHDDDRMEHKGILRFQTTGRRRRMLSAGWGTDKSSLLRRWDHAQFVFNAKKRHKERLCLIQPRLISNTGTTKSLLDR